MSRPVEIVKESPDFVRFTNLASARIGAKCLSCSDDFFAEMDNLIQEGRGVFIPDKYTERGKWMDGWESRRKRTPGNDWCILKLATEGVIKGVDIDTNHFLGNHPPRASIFGINSQEDPAEISKWEKILEKIPLDPGSQNFYEVYNERSWTHLKLNIFPDGGVARLKVYGEVTKDWNTDSRDRVEVSSVLEGAVAHSCNDMFFSNMTNLLMPGKGANMGDGWETKRNRTPNNEDWVIIKLACRADLQEVLVDTHHFKGNYPDSCAIYAADFGKSDTISADSEKWTPLVHRLKLQADNEHNLSAHIQPTGPATHVKLCIYPDGGISRLRIHGKPNPGV